MQLFKNQKNIPNKIRNGQISLLPQVFFSIILEILADAMRYKKQLKSYVFANKECTLRKPRKSFNFNALSCIFVKKNTLFYKK